MFNARSLREQLLIRLVPILLILSATGVLVTYFTALYFSKSAFDRALFNSSLALAGEVDMEDGRVRVELPQTALNMILVDEYDRVYYLISGPHGEPIAGNSDMPQPQPAAPQPGQAYYFDALYNNDKIRIAALYLPLNPAEPEHDLIRVQVAETLVKRELLAKEILLSAVLPQLLLIAFAWIAVHHTVTQRLAPLQKLSEQISNRSHRDLNPVAAEQPPQEVMPLIHAVNDLLLRLAHAISAQQRFIADAAHQLRTPIAGLKIQSELALRQTNPEEIRDALQVLVTGVERTSRLVQQMLLLARAEPGARPAELSMLDVNLLARETTAQWVPRALVKTIDVGYQECAEPAWLEGDRPMLIEMLNNLLDNAVRYTPGGGMVTVQVARGQNQLLLSVEDNGPGIPQGERERVFERFYRVPGSGPDGCGLGLAIVREIAEVHGAEITLDSGTDGRGTRVSVAFTVV